jgi:predicted component of type VI protein secretion system
MIQANASKRVKGSKTTLRASPRTRRIFNNRADELKEKKELYLQKRAKQRQQLEEQSGENLELLHELDVKECMLEIKSVILGKLAADENHLKGFIEVPGKVAVNFNERVKEVAEALTMLKY